MRPWRVTLAMTVTLLLYDPLAAFAADKRPPHSQAQKAAIKKAMQMYGWAIPVCVWPIRADAKPYCFTVSQLIQKFPFHSDYISREILNLAERRYAARHMTQVAPERVLEKLLDQGILAGCVPKGRNRGPITLGLVPNAGTNGNTAADNRLDLMKKGCSNDLSSTVPGIDLTLGVLAGIASNAPGFLDPSDQAAYQGYVDECRSRRALNPVGGIAAGNAGATDEEKKKKAAAEKAKADAEKAKQEAEVAQQKAKEAKQKQEVLEEKAKDRNLSHEEHDQAETAAAQAAVEAQAAQDAADQASDQAAMAEGAAERAQKDADAQKQWDESKRNFAYGLAAFAIGASGAGGLVIAQGEFVLLVERLVYDGLRIINQECMEGSGCAMTCEAQARLRVFRDKWMNSRKPRFKCKLDEMPLPDDDRCYDDPGGFFWPSQADLAHAIEAACKQKEGIDGTCLKLFPRSFTKQSFDPCHGPLVMCAPEQASATPHSRRGPNLGHRPTNSDIKSVPVPATYRGPDPAMWKNPTRSP